MDEIGAFAALHYQPRWVKVKGPGHAFGVQAAVIAALAVIVLITQIQGVSWRKKFPAPKPKKRGL